MNRDTFWTARFKGHHIHGCYDRDLKREVITVGSKEFKNLRAARGYIKGTIKLRLEYFRKQIIDECISYGELAELQCMADEVRETNDKLLMEWAGIPEAEDE